MAKKLVELEWKPRRHNFVDSESGLEVQVMNVGAPKSYDVEASASMPLMLKVEELIRRAARGTPANAYRANYIRTHEGKYRSDYSVTIELYRVIKTRRDRDSTNRNYIL